MFLIILVLVLSLAYLAFKIDKLLRIKAAAAQSLENRLREFEGNFQKILPNTAAYGWYDDGWPLGKTEEESRSPLANPGPGDTADEFAKQLRIAEYLSIQCGRDRVDFLRALKREGQGMTENFLDMVYLDKSAFVRAWAAAHLDLVLNELPDGAANLERPWEALVERRNFRTLLLADPEPIVRGAVWSNPHGGGYSGMIRVHEGWQEEFGNMSQLERLD